MTHIVIVGAGIFGVTGALALRERGLDVSLCDPGPLPHPLAASTDISKAVRMDYGADETYAVLMERCIDGWRAWNLQWGRPLFHEVGTLFMSRSSLKPGNFEHDSFEVLTRRGHRLERLDAHALKDRFPAWSTERYVDGYFNPVGGYVDSAAVVMQLIEDAQAAGVKVRSGVEFDHLLEKDSCVVGIATTDDEVIEADHVVIAAGSWTPHLFPEMGTSLRSVGQPVFHLRPEDPSLFTPRRFPVFGADIAKTGYYGFPANREGIVKIANHGGGRIMHPESEERHVTPAEEAALRAFLADTFPALANAPVVYSRVCLYCDTHDEHFWIAKDPKRAGLVVATGGSGHAFKFAPLIGNWIADAVLERPNSILPKFRWRPDVAPSRGEEAARKHE